AGGRAPVSGQIQARPRNALRQPQKAVKPPPRRGIRQGHVRFHRRPRLPPPLLPPHRHRPRRPHRRGLPPRASLARSENASSRDEAKESLMTSLSRSLYRCLVQLHPPAFRQRFAPEMLWIFDEVADRDARIELFSDALVSLARQWVVRVAIQKLLI